MRVLRGRAVVRIRLINEQKRIDETGAHQTAGDVGIQRQPQVCDRDGLTLRRGVAAVALQQEVSHEFRDAFDTHNHRRAGVGDAGECGRHEAYLRICRTGAQKQGDESKRK